ncbi:alpha/beta hydrolase family protein [Pseudorhodoplanes sp.]|uniref:alpha/beta hydrolase family protein n=1 Tax=Pseudorhodoplanes sp. TaxID=1934341 RepID=UPI00391D5064
MTGLPADVSITVHPLQTQDGAAVNGFLYAKQSAETVLCIMHPREFLATHYLVPDLVSAGYAVFTQTARSVGNDMRLEHEIALLDVAAGLNFLKGAGFKRIILIGNSGGASLYAFYNQQSLKEAGSRHEKTPGGRPTGLVETSMPVADGIVFVSPHPGQGQILLKCIDPSVADEGDALSVTKDLDFLDPANGYRDEPEGSRYSADFVRRFRDAQSERVARLDTVARAMIDERLSARKRAKATGSAADRRKGAHTPVMTIWRTDADLRCWDLSIDPSDRKLGSVWGKDPFTTNYGAVGFSRFCTPEAWLSTWSGHSSRANLFETAKAVEQPCLLIDYTGDNTVFPTDCATIFEAVGSSRKIRKRFRGDHHGRALEKGEEPGRVGAAKGIVEWTNETFG